MRRIFQTPAMARYIAEEIEPGTQCDNDEELLDFIRRRGSTTYHPVGTCRMGQDQKAVVDERLCVRGFSALRVVDASIMPCPGCAWSAAGIGPKPFGATISNLAHWRRQLLRASRPLRRSRGRNQLRLTFARA